MKDLFCPLEISFEKEGWSKEIGSKSPKLRSEATNYAFLGDLALEKSELAPKDRNRFMPTMAQIGS